MKLTWNPPVIDAATFHPATISYLIERSSDDQLFTTIAAVPQTAYTDITVTNGTTYSYRITPLLNHGTAIQAGASSDPVAQTPRDLTAPVPPYSVKVMKTPTGILIFWKPVPENDLAGYHIYRRNGTNTNPERIGTVHSPATRFQDINLPDGTTTLYYSVTAFDQAAIPNQSVASPEESIGLH
ncbi:fibronectin type III domain-containing protein [Thermodesulfobacteriota bacterium]